MTATKRIAVNLLFLVPGDVGGSEEYAVRTLRAFARHGSRDIQPVLFLQGSLRQAHPDLCDEFEVVASPGDGRNRIRRIASESTWLAPRTAGFDVVHHVGGRIPMRSSRPVVVTVHDLQPFDHPEHFSVVKEGFLSWSVPRSLRRADVVVTVSDTVGEQVVRHFGVDPGRVVTVSSGVDSVADRLVEPSSPPVVIYPAVSHPHKNHGLLIEAFSRIADLHPEARLVLTGGPGRSEGAVVLAIEGSGLGDRIERTGRIPDADYVRRLARSSLLAFPSLYEGFGIPVLEAMAAGVPVVVASGTPADDVAGGAGWSVDGDDVSGWAEALDRALGDAEARRVAAEAALRRAAEFSWEASAEQLERAWRLALDTPG